MKIAVLHGGGSSAERDVSLVSGRAVGLALAGRGHDVVMVDPALGDAPVRPQDLAGLAIGREPPRVEAESGAALRAVSGAHVRSSDVVFIAMHGGAGENGTVQGLLELAGKRYTGSGVLASALAMDKQVSKVLFERAGIGVPAWGVVSARSPARSRPWPVAPSFPTDVSPDRAVEVVREVGGCPVIVKPSNQGSSVGLTLVDGDARLSAAIDLAAGYSDSVIIESYIPGREVTVAILGGRALPVVEVVPDRGVYDYESKYTKGMSEYCCPADLPEHVERNLKEAALSAFGVLGCSGYARVDFRLSPENEAYCLEVNTAPGMTDVSLVPLAASAAGMEFGQLLEKIIEIALG